MLPFPAMREGRFYKFWVYIMTSSSGTLYVGMTSFVDTRIFQHKSGEIDGFAKKYKCNRLVYYEEYGDVYVAKRRELRLKGWRRDRNADDTFSGSFGSSSRRSSARLSLRIGQIKIKGCNRRPKERRPSQLPMLPSVFAMRLIKRYFGALLIL